MTQVAGLALPFFGMIFLGFLAGRIWRTEEAGLAWLNIFVIYFALPAMFFRLISRTPLEQLANGRFVIATTLATFSVLAICFGFAMLRTRGDRALSTVQALVGGYGNVGYMGAPLAIAALGPEAAVPAALVFCFDITLVFTLVPLMMALAGRDRHSGAQLFLSIVGKVLLHPFILATIAGVIGAALKVQPPSAIDRLIETLSNAAAPCALFALGVTVALRPLKRVPGELPVLIAMKLVIHPLLALGFLTLIGGMSHIWLATAVLMASLPPAATIYMVAAQYEVYVQRASSGILIGTAVSVFTVTAVLYLVTHGYVT